MNSSKAQKEKDLGNAAFKQGDYPLAIGHYTSAILADPKNPTFPLNRAAAYLKLGKHQDAERDCSLVLALDNNNVKALFRRGQARQSLDNLVDAREDLQRALKLEPSNESVKQEIEKVESTIQKQSTRAKPSAANSISPSAKPDRRRIPIKIVDPPDTANKPISTRPESNSAPKMDLLSPVSSRPLPKDVTRTTSPPSPKPTTPPPPKSTFQEAKQARSSRVGGGIFRSSGSHTILKSSDPQPATSSNTSAPSPIPKSPSPSTPKPAISLFDFTKAWESLSTPQEKWAYMQRQHIVPQSLPAFFQNSLDPTFLSSLLSTLLHILKSKSEDPGTRHLIKEYMINLSRVARFATVLLFMNKEEKAVVKDLWSILIQSSKGEDTEDTNTRRVWGIVD